MRKPSKFTAKRLRKIIAYIKAHPKKYNQGYYCGTACCLAGHALLLFGNKADRKLMEEHKFQFVSGRATKLLHLQLSEWQFVHPLFSGDTIWPARFITRRTYRVTPHQAGKRIEEFIETGRLD